MFASYNYHIGRIRHTMGSEEDDHHMERRHFEEYTAE